MISIPRITRITLVAFILSLPLRADTPAFSLLNKDASTVREFYSSNRDNRMLIRVQVWGDTSLSGIHYIPDNTTLLDLLGYTGGPNGKIADSTITIHHPISSKDECADNTDRIKGDKLISEPDLRAYTLKNGDIVYMDSPAKGDSSFMKGLTLFSSVVGVLSASLALYFVLKK